VSGYQVHMYVGLKFDAELVKEMKEVCVCVCVCMCVCVYVCVCVCVCLCILVRKYPCQVARKHALGICIIHTHTHTLYRSLASSEGEQIGCKVLTARKQRVA